MIPSHAPPSYFSDLSLMDYLQAFYCWYIGSFENRKIQELFHRLLILSRENLLSKEATLLAIKELDLLADSLRSASLSLSSFENALLKIEEKMTEDNPKAKLLSLLYKVRSKTDLFTGEKAPFFLALIQNLDPKNLDRFMSHAAAQLLSAYLKNPESITPLEELQKLSLSWKE